MILSVYSVRDRLVGFLTPVLEQNDAIAMRNFSMACDKSSHDSTLMTWKPSDYSLYRIASFDSDSGLISPVSPPELVCSGDSFRGDSNA